MTPKLIFAINSDPKCGLIVSIKLKLIYVLLTRKIIIKYASHRAFLKSSDFTLAFHIGLELVT